MLRLIVVKGAQSTLKRFKLQSVSSFYPDQDLDM